MAKKWKYLRSQLTDEIRKERATKSGMGSGDVYVSKWKWRQLLRFLDDRILLKPVATVTNLCLTVCVLLFHG